MKKVIADLWVEALRSGMYDQGKEALNHEQCFCCLGVLCEVAIKDGLQLEKANELSEGKLTGAVVYDGAYCTLPSSVMEWAGIRDQYGKFNAKKMKSLVRLNDNGMSFDGIADVIEKNYHLL